MRRKIFGYLIGIKMEQFYKLFDIPSGAVMGITTILMWVFSIGVFFFGMKMPAAILVFYAMVLGAFSISKKVHKTLKNGSTVDIEETAGGDKEALSAVEKITSQV